MIWWDRRCYGGPGHDGVWPNGRIHTAKFLRLSEDLPIIIEIVDTREKLQHFLETVDRAIDEGLSTLEKAYVHFYRSS